MLSKLFILDVHYISWSIWGNGRTGSISFHYLSSWKSKVSRRFTSNNIERFRHAGVQPVSIKGTRSRGHWNDECVCQMALQTKLNHG